MLFAKVEDVIDPSNAILDGSEVIVCGKAKNQLSVAVKHLDVRDRTIPHVYLLTNGELQPGEVVGVDHFKEATN